MKQLNRKSRSALSCVGMVILGVILVIVGTILQNHFKLGAAVCNTFDNTSTGCVTNSSAFSAGQIIDSIGKFLVIGGLASGGLLMLSNILDNRPKAASQQPAAGPTTTMPGTSPASNARSGNPMISQTAAGQQRRNELVAAPGREHGGPHAERGSKRRSRRDRAAVCRREKRE